MQAASLLVVVVVVVVLSWVSVVQALGLGVRQPLVVKKGERTKFLKLRLKLPISSHCKKYKGKAYYRTVTVHEGDNVLLPCHYCGDYVVREKMWFRTAYVWQQPWDMEAKLRQVGGERLTFQYKTILDLVRKRKNKRRRVSLTTEEERLLKLRRKRLQVAGPWPTERGRRRMFGKKKPLPVWRVVRDQYTLMEQVWRYKLYHNQVELGQQKKFLSQYKEIIGHPSLTKTMKQQLSKMQHEPLPWQVLAQGGELAEQQVQLLWYIWLHESDVQYRRGRRVSWNDFVRKYVTTLSTRRLTLQLVEKIKKIVRQKQYEPTLTKVEDAPFYEAPQEGEATNTMEDDHVQLEQVKPLPRHKAEAVLQQRILHKDFHRVINDTRRPLMERYQEKLAKYKSGKKPQPPDGFLEQSLHFTWNDDNKKKAKQIHLDQLLFDISAGNTENVKARAKTIASSRQLWDAAKSLKVSGLVRTINAHTLTMEDTQQKAVQLYDVTKMLEMAAERRRYEPVMQHLLGVYAVRAKHYNLINHITFLKPRHRLLHLSDESLVLYRTTLDDSGLYTCSSGYSEDFGYRSFTYNLEVLEARGQFVQQEGNQDDYEAYKAKVESKYNNILMQHWHQDDAFLNNTMFEVYEGSESQCSACSGKDGVIKRDIQLRIFNVNVKYKLSLKSRIKDKFNLLKTSILNRKIQWTKKPEPRGIHLRSSDLNKLAPTFHNEAAHRIAEFQLLTPCVGTSECPQHESNLTPDHFFDRQPFAYVHVASEGSSVTLRCPTRHPTKVVWHYDAKPLLPTKHVFINQGQVGVTNVNRNTTGNYSCTLVVTRNNTTTHLPQGFVYLKVSTSMVQLQFYKAVQLVVGVFLMQVLLLVPLSCSMATHAWYRQEAQRYLVYMTTMKTLKQAMRNTRKAAQYREARKVQRLKLIIQTIETRNLCQMITLQQSIVQRVNTHTDEDEWLNLLSSEIWKLQNTAKSGAFE